MVSGSVAKKLRRVAKVLSVKGDIPLEIQYRLKSENSRTICLSRCSKQLYKSIKKHFKVLEDGRQREKVLRDFSQM